MKESFEGFDFKLQPVVIVGLSALGQGESGRIGPNPDASAYLSPKRPIASATGWNLTKSGHGIMPSSNAVDFPRRPTLISEAIPFAKSNFRKERSFPR